MRERLNWRSSWDPAPRIVILPVGSFEQHGPHLPLETDTIIAYTIAVRVAEELGAPLLPPIPYGVSPEHMGFPGTITIDPVNYCLLLRDILSSLSRHGVELLAIINGHGGNIDTLRSCTTHWNMTHDKPKAHHVWIWGHAENLLGDKHAGPLETSLITHILDTEPVEAEGRDCPGVFHLLPTDECAPNGIVYNGRFQASKEYGERILEELTKGILGEICNIANVLNIQMPGCSPSR